MSTYEHAYMLNPATNPVIHVQHAHLTNRRSSSSKLLRILSYNKFSIRNILGRDVEVSAAKYSNSVERSIRTSDMFADMIR
jgi:hypothetical protein